MIQPSATRGSCIATLWVSLLSFAAMTLYVASQRVFIVVVYFVIDSVRKLLDTPSYAYPVKIVTRKHSVILSFPRRLLTSIFICEINEIWFQKPAHV